MVYLVEEREMRFLLCRLLLEVSEEDCCQHKNTSAHLKLLCVLAASRRLIPLLGNRPPSLKHAPIFIRISPGAVLQVLACQIAVTGRLGMGLVVGGFMASLLLRQNVAGSVRVMPSTVLLLVLGVACGYAGKQAVDR